jgi:excisionase family DNA binding protein
VKVKEVAERLEVSADTVYALVSAGKLRCNRIGVGRGTIRVTEEQLAEFLAGTESRPPAPPKASTPKLKLRHLRA